MREHLKSEKKMPCDPLVDPLFVMDKYIYSTYIGTRR